MHFLSVLQILHDSPYAGRLILEAVADVCGKYPPFRLKTTEELAEVQYTFLEPFFIRIRRSLKDLNNSTVYPAAKRHELAAELAKWLLDQGLLKKA